MINFIRLLLVIFFIIIIFSQIGYTKLLFYDNFAARYKIKNPPELILLLELALGNFLTHFLYRNRLKTSVFYIF
jgi:hypothetical protein